jgi:hypothetical protein
MKILLFLFVLLSALITQAQQKVDSIVKPLGPAAAYKGAVHPKILFDEGHHNFHTSTGRYQPFAELLTGDGYILVVNKVKISMDALAGNDVFVCANAFATGPDSVTGRLPATPAFTADECQTLKQWVLNGGSLWLIADHEPAGDAVANLSDSFQVNMSKAYTVDPRNFDKVVFNASWIRFSIENNNLGSHPIINGRNEKERIKNLLSFTGQSLKGPQGSIPILQLSDEAYDVFNVEDPLKATIEPAKGRCQALAMPFGKGRVVIWGEAAMLTAQARDFGMDYPGVDNRQLVLNIAHWLTKLL